LYDKYAKRALHFLVYLPPLWVLVLIFVFGSNSLLARAFLLCLSGIDAPLTTVSRTQSTDRFPHLLCDLSQPFDFISGNIRNSLVEYQRPVLVFFSWSGTPRSSISINPAQHFIDNLNIINNISSIIQLSAPSLVLFVSSAGALYPLNTVPAVESAPVYPTSPYGDQKAFAETTLSTTCCIAGSRFVSARITTAYDLTNPGNPQGVVNRWIFDRLLHNRIDLYSDLESRVNFISANQVADSLVKLIGSSAHGIFNIGSLHETSLSSLLNAILSATNDLSFPTLTRNRKSLPLMSLPVDTAKAMNVASILNPSLLLRDVPVLVDKARLHLSSLY